MPFQKGKSGNPRGRPRGASQAAKLREAINADLPEIIKALVRQAKEGDVQAAKLLLDRSMPALKPMQQTATVQGLKGKTPTQQALLVIAAMAEGQLTPEQAQTMLAGLTSFSRIKELDEIEKRLSALESNLSTDRN